MIRMMLKPAAGCEFTEIDKFGIWGPHSERIDLKRLIEQRGGIDVQWLPLYGLTNIPPVITWLMEGMDGSPLIFDSRWCWEHGIVEGLYQGEA